MKFITQPAKVNLFAGQRKDNKAMKPCLYCFEFTDNQCACGAYQCSECASGPCPMCVRMLLISRQPRPKHLVVRLEAIETRKMPAFYEDQTDPHATAKESLEINF